MKCLIGVETVDDMRESVEMLKRLAPKSLEIRLLHVVDSVRSVPGYGFFPGHDATASIVEALQDSGERILAQAEQEARQQGISCTAKMEWGPVSANLLDEAKAIGADLVALHRKDASGLERLFLGSVSRAAVMDATQSVLVTKGQVAPSGDVTAVLATDHSDYCNRCIDKLAAMDFSGIKRLHVVSANPDPTVYDDPPDEHGLRIRSELEAKTEAVCERFRARGVECTPIVAEGPVVRVLRDAMVASKADLMIVGAQGHGFVEQFVIGSISLHQVAAEPYSVLVLRV